MTNGNDSMNPVVKPGFTYGDGSYEESTVSQKGLTKREYFAAMAMQGLLANTTFYEIVKNHLPAEQVCDFYSEVAIDQADSLTAQLNKQL